MRLALVVPLFTACAGMVSGGTGGGAQGGGIAATGGGDAGPGGGEPAGGGGGATGGGATGGDSGGSGGGTIDAGPTLPRFVDRCVRPMSPGEPAPLRTLYIDAVNGSDTNTGTAQAQAWKTLAKANNSVQPGDLVYVTGTFDGGYLRPTASGTATNPIVFKAQGSAIIMNAQYSIAFWVTGKSWLVFDGFELAGDEAPVDFLNTDHVVVRNSVITANGYARIIDSDDNRFEDNTWQRCGTYCMFMSQGSHRNVIRGNRFGDSSSISLYLAGTAAAPSADNEVSFNDLDNALDGQLTLTGRITGTRITCNRIHGAGAGLVDAGPSPALTVTASGNRISENLFYGNAGEAVRFQAFTGNDCDDNVMVHNTLWNNGGPPLRFLLSQANATLERNEVRDNVFWGNNVSTDFHWTVGSTRYEVVFDTYHQQVNGYADGGLGDNHVHHNLIGRDEADIDGGWLYFIGYSRNVTLSLAQAQARWPELHDNFEADPKLASAATGDFMLLPGSPAIDRAGPDDGGFSAVGSAPDLGRYEWQP